jgi:hypothetical protein
MTLPTGRQVWSVDSLVNSEIGFEDSMYCEVAIAWCFWLAFKDSQGA